MQVRRHSWAARQARRGRGDSTRGRRGRGGCKAGTEPRGEGAAEAVRADVGSRGEPGRQGTAQLSDCKGVLALPRGLVLSCLYNDLAGSLPSPFTDRSRPLADQCSILVLFSRPPYLPAYACRHCATPPPRPLQHATRARCTFGPHGARRTDCGEGEASALYLLRHYGDAPFSRHPASGSLTRGDRRIPTRRVRCRSSLPLEMRYQPSSANSVCGRMITSENCPRPPEPLWLQLTSPLRYSRIRL